MAALSPMILPYGSNMAISIPQLTYSYPTSRKKRERFCFMDALAKLPLITWIMIVLSAQFQTNHFDQKCGYSNWLKPIRASLGLRKDQDHQNHMAENRRVASQRKLGLCRSKKEEGNGTRLQYSCLENPMDGGAW